jgi:hypothetical protein
MILRLLLFSLTFSAFAAEQYQLKGSLGINAATKKNIEFTLNWQENGNVANGTYSDNLYTSSTAAKGVVGDLGRIFVVTLPKEVGRVRTITILGPSMSGEKGAALVPVSVVLRDSKGRPVTTTSIEANLIGLTSKVVAQKQEEAICQEGFGELAGYCGEYIGMISEERDTQQNCDLLSFSGRRLIFDLNAEIGLALGESSTIVAIPIHRIGRVLADPQSRRVDLISRKCHSLTGIKFASDNCKRLNLSGVFSIVNDLKHFSGDYTITDEKTNASCRYNLSMDLTE